MIRKIQLDRILVTILYADLVGSVKNNPEVNKQTKKGSGRLRKVWAWN